MRRFTSALIALLGSAVLGSAAAAPVRAESVVLTADETSEADISVVIGSLSAMATTGVGGEVSADRDGSDWLLLDVAITADSFTADVSGIPVTVSDVLIQLPAGIDSLMGVELDTGSGPVVRFDSAQCPGCDDFTAELSFTLNGTPSDELVDEPIVATQALDFALEESPLALSETLVFDASIPLGALGNAQLDAEFFVRLVPEPAEPLGRLAALAGVAALWRRRSAHAR